MSSSPAIPKVSQKSLAMSTHTLNYAAALNAYPQSLIPLPEHDALSFSTTTTVGGFHAFLTWTGIYDTAIHPRTAAGARKARRPVGQRRQQREKQREWEPPPSAASFSDFSDTRGLVARRLARGLGLGSRVVVRGLAPAAAPTSTQQSPGSHTRRRRFGAQQA